MRTHRAIVADFENDNEKKKKEKSSSWSSNGKKFAAGCVAGFAIAAIGVPELPFLIICAAIVQNRKNT